MAKLYIIGNGFDLHHNLHTSYSDYQNYLIKHQLCTTILKKFPKGDEFWSHIETKLYFDFKEYIKKSIKAYNYILPKPGCSTNQDLCLIAQLREQDLYLKELPEFTGINFYLWLNQAYTSLSINKDLKLSTFSPNDRFITFNYTSTLEDVYEINKEQILYIHGKLDKVEKHDLIIEHTFSSWPPVLEMRHENVRSYLQFGNPSNDYEKMEKWASNLHVQARNDLFSMKQVIDDLSYYLRSTFKSIDSNITRLEEFLKYNEPLHEVVILGHSFAGIDFKYYKLVLIPRFMDRNWTIYCHGDEDTAIQFATDNNLNIKCESW